MPIYEYECKKCGKRFDVMQKLADEPVKECRFCKGKVRKLLGTPALQFKGTGWYVTDYAGKTPKPEGNGKGKEQNKDKPAKPDAPACSACCPSAGECAAKNDKS